MKLSFRKWILLFREIKDPRNFVNSREFVKKLKPLKYIFWASRNLKSVKIYTFKIL